MLSYDLPISFLLLIPLLGMVRGGGTDSPSLPHNWTLPHPHPHPQFHTSSSGKSVDDGRAFISSSAGLAQYPSAEARHNLLPMAGPPGAFYKPQQPPLQDKSSFRSSGFLTNSGKTSVAQGFSYTPRLPSSAAQDPIQSRIGGFTFPQSARIATGHRFFGAGGAFHPLGYYGAKNPPGQTIPLPVPQHLRGSRVFDNISYKPRDPNKKTGVYVVPTPSKLYFDGVKN